MEPFGGAGSILMLKPRVLSEVYNDLDGNVVNVFRVLRDPVKAQQLQRRLALTPFARAEFEDTYIEPVDDIDAAAKTIVRSFFGHGSDSATRGVRTGFRAKSHARALPSVEWASWPSEVPAFTERLSGIVIEQRDASEIISRYDTPNTLIYVDPPYVHSTRGRVGGTHGYRHELDDDHHRALAQQLETVRGMVVISGYDCPLYRDLYSGWERHEKKHAADRGLARMEVIWMNRHCSAALHGSMRPGAGLDFTSHDSERDAALP